jgi:predicted N-acetyltransferase YhbS
MQRRGVGRALIERALDTARAGGADGCVVLGDPRYYGRFGFEHRPDLTFAGAPTPYFQALVFNGGDPRGSVTYDRAFA